MTKALLDDHLLRDLLADEMSDDLRAVIHQHEPATTNLYLFRLCRSVAAARGGTLTGGWTPERRRELGAQLVGLSDDVEIVPMRAISFSMAEIVAAYPVSTLGAEAVASSLHLNAALFVWDGDDGPQIRAAMASHQAEYHTIHR